MLLEEDLKARQDASQGTTMFLTKQVEDAKQTLDDLDKKLAAFKNQHMGQLPGDEDNNLKILMGLNSQLDATTQNLNRATQDKAYTESMLTQQLSAWKPRNPAAILRRCNNSYRNYSPSSLTWRRAIPKIIRM